MRNKLKERGGYEGKMNPNFGKYKIDKQLWPDIYEKIKGGVESHLTIGKKYSIHPTSVKNYMRKYKEENGL
jgi:DNA invertase Pin-like site-specific DNA recombinase